MNAKLRCRNPSAKPDSDQSMATRTSKLAISRLTPSPKSSRAKAGVTLTDAAACCPSHAADAGVVADLPEVAREAYRVLLEGGGAMTAYALIEALQARIERRIYPQTVYRALTTLVEKSLVHRLESANSYRACSAPGTPHDGIHFLCSRCGGVEEAIDAGINDLLSKHAGLHRFAIDNRMIEVNGVCARCSG
jgi:Fur family zinc uptake transcriptional regulator